MRKKQIKKLWIIKWSDRHGSGYLRKIEPYIEDNGDVIDFGIACQSADATKYTKAEAEKLARKYNEWLGQAYYYEAVLYAKERLLGK